MAVTLSDILGPDGAIARRLGDKYEHRPEQLEMAAAVESAFAGGHHLLVEAGTGVGKSFAYLIPAIDFAVRHKKRVVISTHTISLQEQLIDKDIPLLRSILPDEFTAVLVKGRNNYLCQRRLQQTRGRQGMLFDHQRQLDSLWMVEEWATHTTEGSLADLPALPEPEVWDKVCAEHGNCLGKRCEFYDKCFWQAAKRRMQSGNILVVNHALFFSDLALRMAGVNYLPKYDLAILDEAHTLEDVAGEHFGLKITEGGLKYELRALYEPRKGRGILSVHGANANDAIRVVVDLHERAERFFERCLRWQKTGGRANGRIYQPNWVENDLSPKLRDLTKRLKAMLTNIDHEEDVAELTSHANKVAAMAESLDGILSQSMPDAVYWMGSTPRAPRRVSLHAAPIDIADGLRQYLFDKLPSVVMTSATLCTTAVHRTTGVPPVPAVPADYKLNIRQGAHLPHWTRQGSIYAVCFRLADSLPAKVVQAWVSERDAIVAMAKQQNRPLTPTESARLRELYSQKVDRYLDAAQGDCWLSRPDVSELIADALRHFEDDRYRLLAWCIMPNHVHVILQPLRGNELPAILHAWKSFTAHATNKMLNRDGEFWAVEYYDHLIRDERDLIHAVEYAWNNPEQAGFKDWKQRGRNDALINELLGNPTPPHGRDARDTKNATRTTGVPPVPTAPTRTTGVPPVPTASAHQPDVQRPQESSRRTKQPDPRFAYIQSRLGITKSHTLALGSPFDYPQQATLYIETNLPDPSDTMRFFPAACERIEHYIRQTNGGAFILFTSYKMLKDAASRLRPQLEESGYPVLVHGEGAPRKILLERFRAQENAVLFGTASFWQGIDVQGNALRNVIITKLPFAVPDEPIVEARLEMIQRRGGNPFMEYSVPEAVIKLKQGFGRLIRSRSDRGIVVILDGRVMTKRYGRTFLDALPDCRRIVVR